MNNQRRKSIARDLKDLKLAYENLIAVKIAEEAAMKQVPMNDEYEDKRDAMENIIDTLDTIISRLEEAISTLDDAVF